MAEEREPIETSAGTDDSFEALLKRAAHVSAPAVASLGPQLHPGSVLLDGRLQIVRRIGEGGMGVVYEVHDAQRRGSVALKTLSRLDAGSVYRLKNEFRSLADVSHPNVCRLHELFSEGGQWFFTMELIAGERFDHWVRPGGVLDETRLRAALPQLCEGIAAIHAVGKLHRDLKPSNVLVAPQAPAQPGAGTQARVVVLDFGLAIDPELGGVGQTVMDQSVSGTPGYMAPEQAAGLPATEASDFYALGAMLFEALTGKLPFEGRAHEMLTDKQRSEAPRARDVSPAVPRDLDALCSALLARDPAARPNAMALRAQLGLTPITDTGSTQRARASNAARASSASLSPDAAPELLGRQNELQALRNAYAETLAGKPVTLFVSGESGMGKSALVAAFLDSLRASGQATVIPGRCYERENVPFKGFDSVVDELSRHLRKLPAHEAAALLPREVYALARVFPVLDRVPVVAEAPKKDVPDPQDLKRRAFEAFMELTARMRDRAPLVMFIDDIQWLDQDSVHFLRASFARADLVPALLIFAHRSEGAADNALLQSVLQAAGDNSALNMRTLHVAPLPAGALALLAQRLLPGGTDAAAAAQFVLESRGSPFFAGELARAAAVRAPGAALPSLADALALHIAALPAGAQRLLSLLSLAGQPLPASLVVEASSISDGHSELDRLRSEQLVRVSLAIDGERSVECYHDKIREHVFATLEPLHLRELSLALSRALLAQADSDPELVARCLELAGAPAEAAVHAARAADAAFTALAFERAARLYTQALDQGQFEPARAQALRVNKAEALAHAGRGERSAEAFVEAAKHASGDDDVDALTHKAGEQYSLCGDLEHGRDLLDRALRRVGHTLPQGPAALVASLVWWRSRLRLRGLSFTPRTDQDPATLRELQALRVATHCLIRTDQVRAADLSARWVLRALDAGHAVELARALPWELLITSLTGGSEERVQQIYALGAQLSEQTADQFAQYWLPYCYGIHLLIRVGAAERALPEFERALEFVAMYPSPTSSYDRGWIAHFRATAVMMSGRLQEAGELAHVLLEDAHARGDNTVSIVMAPTAVVALLAAGMPDQAQRLLDDARARLRPGEVTLQDFYMVGLGTGVNCYRGSALEAWRVGRPDVERFMKSFQGRVMMRGSLEVSMSGLLAAASRETQDPSERRDLIRKAKRFARRALAPEKAINVWGCSEAVLACLRNDRAGAVAALQRQLRLSLVPFTAQVLRRRLGELLGGDEGNALLAEADAFLREGGVVDPARFVAMVLPGIELPA